MAKFFLSQTLLDRWMADEVATLEGDRLVLAGVALQVVLRPAVYFVSSDGAEEGQAAGQPVSPEAGKILGTVLDSEALAAMGAEHYDTAVIVNDAAYSVLPGFVTEIDGEAGSPPSDPSEWLAQIELLSSQAEGSGPARNRQLGAN